MRWKLPMPLETPGSHHAYTLNTTHGFRPGDFSTTVELCQEFPVSIDISLPAGVHRIQKQNQFVVILRGNVQVCVVNLIEVYLQWFLDVRNRRSSPRRR